MGEAEAVGEDISECEVEGGVPLLARQPLVGGGAEHRLRREDGAAEQALDVAAQHHAHQRLVQHRREPGDQIVHLRLP